MKIATKIPMVNSFKLCLYGVFIALFILSCGASTTGTNPPVAQYTVTFDLNGGTGTPAQEIVSGGMASKPTDPTRTGHTFDGWYTMQTPTDTDTEFNFQNTAITEAITLYAKWTINSYIVTFDLSEGSGNPAAQKIVFGRMATKPVDPTRMGHTFAGWYTSQTPTDTDTEFDFQNTAITEAITLYANWTRNTYVVTFDFNYDNAPTATTERTDATGKVTQADPTRTSFNFVGWYTNAAGEGTVVDLDTQEFLVNTTLYAKWTTKFTVNFVVDGGSAINPLEVDSGAIVSRPADPTRTGHTFDNWYKDQALKQLFDFGSETITGNTRIYAKWTINSYTVVFDMDSGTPQAPPQTINYGTTVTEPTDPTRPGYTFGGWYKDSQFATEFDFEAETITANITLYAKWTRTYTVSFDANGGTGAPSSVSVVVGSTLSFPTPPTRASMYFGGWYTGQQDKDQHGRTKHKASTPVTNDLTLYARWYTEQPADKAALSNLITAATPTADFNHIDVRQVIDLANLFQYNTNFNGAISRWDVSEVTNMQHMFEYSGFNGELKNWDTGNVRDMSSMFLKVSFNKDIGGWNTGNVRDMSYMFLNASSFNQDIGEWNTSNVKSMREMFYGASSFNKDIGGWKTGNVRDMSYMFLNASSFNQDIGEWNTAKVIEMGGMFFRASAFNKDIGEWNTSNVKDMRAMFSSASSFNKDIGEWNTGNVKNMYEMFKYASSFNQDLTKWLNTANPSTVNMFLSATAMTAANKACWMPAPVPPTC